MASIPPVVHQFSSQHNQISQDRDKTGEVSGASPSESNSDRLDIKPVRKKKSFIADQLRAQLSTATLGLVPSDSPQPSGGPALTKSKSRSILNLRKLFRAGSDNVADRAPVAATGSDEVLSYSNANQGSAETPITHLKTPEEIISAIDIMEHNLKLWEPMDSSEFTLQAMKEIDDTDWQAPKRTYEQRWQDRLATTKTALSNMRNATLHRHKAFVYCVDGIPIGLMLLTMPRDPAAYKEAPGVYIHDVVTHPGSAGCGGQLIAQAIAESVQQGQKGMLKLVPENEDAKYAYKKLGFTPSSKGMFFELHPATSNKWVFHHGNWQLRQFKAEKHTE